MRTEEGCAERTAGGGDVQIRQRAGQQAVQRGVDQHGRQADQVEHEELADGPVEACTFTAISALHALATKWHPIAGVSLSMQGRE